MNLAKICAEQPMLAVMLNLVFIFLGVVSFSTLTMDLFPEVDVPIVTVRTVWRDAAAERRRPADSLEVRYWCVPHHGADAHRRSTAARVVRAGGRRGEGRLVAGGGLGGEFVPKSNNT